MRTQKRQGYFDDEDGQVRLTSSRALLGVHTAGVRVLASTSRQVVVCSCSSRSAGLRYVNGNPTKSTPPTTLPTVL